MPWYGTTKTSYTLDEGITFGAGNQPYNDRKWVVRMWKDNKYLELGRELPGNANVTITTTPGSKKGDALLRVLGNRTSFTTDRINAIQYSGGNWADGNIKNHFTMDLPNITITVPDTDLYRPNATVNLELIDALNGKWIQGKTRANIVSDVSLLQGTTLKEVVHTFSEGSESCWGISVTKQNPFGSAGTKTITTKVTDSRGRSRTLNQTVEVLAYSSPQVSNFVVQRCNDSGTLMESGTYSKVTYAYSVYNIAGSLNTASVRIEYWNGSSWVALKTFTALSGNSSFVTGNICPTSSTVQFRIVVTDKFETQTRTAEIVPSQAWIGHSTNSIIFGREYSTADEGKTISARPFVAEKYSELKDAVVMGRGYSSSDAGKIVAAKPFISESTAEFNNTSTFKSQAKFDGTLNFATDSAKKSLIDTFIPVGSVRWFTNAVDPNNLYPGTTWARRYITLASVINQGYSLNVDGGVVSNGRNVQVWTSDGSDAHKFHLYGFERNGTESTAIRLWIRTA